MDLFKRNWLPSWPVVPPRLWLTVAGGVVAGLSIIFRMEIWPHQPKAEMWSWVVLGVLVPAGGIQVIRVLRVWRREYRGPGWVRLLMWGAVLPVCVAVALLIIGFAFLLCFNLGSITQD
jgi:hypothetical protein